MKQLGVCWTSSEFYSFNRRVNKLEEDTHENNDPAKDNTDLVPLNQNNMDQTTLENTIEVTAGSEIGFSV